MSIAVDGKREKVYGNWSPRMSDTAVEERIQKSKVEIFFCGGHGGSVTYDGDGGIMEKTGGPMDRLFCLRREGELGGNLGLDIAYGAIYFRTGKLAQDVELTQDRAGDSNVIFRFWEDDNDRSVVVTGGIAELGLPVNTVLFHGNVEPSEMVWDVGNVTGDLPVLPYTALHSNVNLHPEIARRYGLKSPVKGLAVTMWCKPTPIEMNFKECSSKGARFCTQQHLGVLRLLIDG